MKRGRSKTVIIVVYMRGSQNSVLRTLTVSVGSTMIVGYESCIVCVKE